MNDTAKLIEALTVGRDAVMETYEHVTSKDDQYRADMRLQCITAALASITPSAPALWGYLCNGSGDGWRETEVIIRAYDAETIARYRERPEQWSMQPLYLGDTAPPVHAPALWAPVAGRIGLTRDGRKVTGFSAGAVGHRAWVGTLGGYLTRSWNADGSYQSPDISHPLDLVAEWTEVQK